MDKQDVIPFWHNVPAIFKYPAKTESLMTIGGFSVLWLLTGIGGIIGLFVALALTMATYNFAYAILVHTARGHIEEPPKRLFTHTSDSVFWKQIGMWFLMTAAVLATYHYINPFLSSLVGLFILIGLPVATMSLAIDQDIGRALNPMVWIEVMRRIGWPYAVMIVFLFLMISSSAAMQRFLVPIMPGILGSIVLNFVSMYFLVAMFFMMGYVIFQYRQELGFEPMGMTSQSLTLTPEQQRQMQAQEEIDALIAEGDAETAKSTLAEGLRQHGPLSPLHDQYRKLCRLTNDDASLLTHGKSQITAMMTLDNPQKAMQLAQECYELDKRFELENPLHVLPLATLASESGRSRLAVQIANGFNKRHPKHKDVVAVLFLTAQILVNRIGDDAKAFQIVRYLVAKYPDHELMPEVEQLKQVLDAVNQ